MRKKILIDIGHPAHVHFFKNFIQEMKRRGHDLIVTARDKDVALRLLEAYDIGYTAIGRAKEGKFNLIIEWAGRDWGIYLIARKFRPDILTGIGNPCVTHTAWLTGAKSVIFADTEHAKLENMITFPFADVICTPSCFKKDLGRKQVRYNGYHELAYLHPNYFKPAPSVLRELGLSENDRFIIVRFVSWSACHDTGQHGFNLPEKRKLIRELEKCGRVLISSEGILPDEFGEYKITTTPEKLHNLLYYATLYIGEGATMATEAAMVGTPSIYTSSLVGAMGNFIELSEKYDLVRSFRDVNEAIQEASKLLGQLSLKQQWAKKRERLLADKIDVTGFMVNLIENYVSKGGR